MSSYEENWETGVLVTAEAVYGIGFCGEAAVAAEESSAARHELPVDEEFSEAAD